MSPVPNYMLNKDPDQIQQMELDLVGKVQAAYTAAQIQVGVHGIFSIDDLEKKLESEICDSGITIGVGYMGAESLSVDEQLNVARGQAVRIVEFNFLVILAVGYTEGCMERYDATKLLTLQRRGIMGTAIANDMTNRTWRFVKEGPEVAASSDVLLFYSQVWRAALPQLGNNS